MAIQDSLKLRDGREVRKGDKVLVLVEAEVASISTDPGSSTYIRTRNPLLIIQEAQIQSIQPAKGAIQEAEKTLPANSHPS